MNPRDSLHIVVIDGAKNRASTYAAILEKAGYDVRCDHAADSKKLEDLLDNALPDIVLYGMGAKIPSLVSVSATLRKRAHETPPLVIAGEETENLVSIVQKELQSARLQRRISNLETEVENIRLQQRINELENALKEQEIHCQGLVENSRDAIAYIYEGKHVYGNQTYLNKFGFESNEELRGTPIQHLVDSGDHELLAGLLRHYGSNKVTTANIKLIQCGAYTADADAKFSPVRFDNKLCTRITVGGDAQVTKSGRDLDIFDQRDVFTGLYNRQYFIRVLDENIRNNAGLGLFQSITYVLLDNFKTIRENIGVIASDQMISEIAGLIEEVCGSDAIVAQFGDYVFTILSKSSNMETSCLLAETLRQRLEEYKSVIQGHVVRTTGSIGICAINEHVKDAENALARADLACELARSSGGNQVHVHSTAIDDQINNDVEEHWDEMIRKTMNEDRFYLVYQPIVSLNTDKDARYEVLLRVIDEEGHVILPGQFISIAEKTGVIGDIDRRVISMALKTLSDQQGKEISLFIKISGHTLSDSEFPGWMQQQLKQQCLQGCQVIFEITESAAVNDGYKTRKFVHAMHKLQCKVAIEHLGQATQPGKIRNLPVDFLKVDGSLINNLLSSKKDQATVKTILEFAREERIPCIAERVDEASCLVMLWQYSVDFIQGNFVQEPGKHLEYDFDDEIASPGLVEAS